MSENRVIYHECHIVTPYPHAVGAQHGFWGGVITKDDHGDDQEGDYFFTSRDTRYDALEDRMLRLLAALENAGVKVKRYKIETARVDSNHNQDLYKLRSY